MAPMWHDLLSLARDLDGAIDASRVYIRTGRKAPQDTEVKTGPRGGRYYDSEGRGKRPAVSPRAREKWTERFGEHGERFGQPPEPPRVKAKAPPSDRSRFRTAQGSEYVFSGGRSIRRDSVHHGHAAEDVGWGRRSDRTYFIDPAKTREVRLWQEAPAEGKRIVARGGDLLLTSVGRDGRRRLDTRVPVTSDSPRAGVAPVELWGGGGAYHTSRVGNRIV